MDLVRDLLDTGLIDREGRRLGRVDGVLLELRANRPPRVVAMESGLFTMARRLHPALARWLRRLAARWSPVPLRSVRLPMAVCRDIGVDVDVDVDARDDPKLLRFEKWLGRHVIGKIPGGRA
jgi:hypothetical protein